VTPDVADPLGVPFDADPCLPEQQSFTRVLFGPPPPR
jgi:hypothetical protein